MAKKSRTNKQQPKKNVVQKNIIKEDFKNEVDANTLLNAYVLTKDEFDIIEKNQKRYGTFSNLEILFLSMTIQFILSSVLFFFFPGIFRNINSTQELYWPVIIIIFVYLLIGVVSAIVFVLLRVFGESSFRYYNKLRYKIKKSFKETDATITKSELLRLLDKIIKEKHKL